jgi:GNAT superfamily N-acetyltransferase
MATESPVEYSFARTPVEYDAAVRFYRQMLPASARVIELLEWRRRIPLQELAPMTFVARLDGRVVGAMNVVPQPLVAGGRALKAAWQQDSVVDKSLRGRGIGRELINRSAVGYDVVLAKGTSPPMYALRKSCGFRDVARSNYLVKVLAARHFGNSAKHLLYGLALRGLSIAQRRPQRTSLQTRVLHEFGPEFDGLASSPHRATEVRAAKDSAYLNWRYRGCPGRDYQIVGAVDANGTAAAVVNVALTHGMGPAPAHSAWIVDIVCDASQTSTIVGLVRECVSLCRAAGAGSVFTFATSHRVSNCLQREGFVETRQKPPFTYRVERKDDELERMLHHELSWSFCHGDGDNELYD